MTVSKKFIPAEPVLSVGLIILATLLTYGVLIPHLGFYRDDWYMIWTAQSEGAQGVINLFKGDRPFIGLLYAFDYSLLGKSTLNWHIYALFIKLLGAFGLFWLLRMIWPERKVETTFVTILFMIYPGFYQQGNAATFKNLLLAESAVMFSLALTIYSIKTKSLVGRILAIVLAISLEIFSVAIYEVLIGLEGARFLLTYYFIYKQETPGSYRSALLKSIKWMIPYVVFALAFISWRVFFFDSTRRAVSADLIFERYSALPLHSIVAILTELMKDIVETTVFAWSVPYYTFTQTTANYREFWLGMMIAASVIGLAFAYYLWAKRQNWLKPEIAAPPTVFRDFMILGILIVIITSIPIVAAGRNVIFGLQWDRYTAQSILGVVLFVVGFVFYALRSSARWWFLFALLGVSVCTQYFSALSYSQFWNMERNMWWQLSWRAPDFAPGTTVIGVAPRGLRYAEEYEVWGPVNIIYSPGGPLRVSGQALYPGIDVDMATHKQEVRNNRNILIPRDYGKAVIVSVPSLSSCVHVINGDELELPSFEDPAVAAAAPYSKIDLVLTDAKSYVPPADVFGTEPPHTWCFYYEKMDLARQKQDWESVIRLGEEAQSLDLHAVDTSEWMPLYVAYVHAGELEKAKAVVITYMKPDKGMRDALCIQARQTKWPAGYNAEDLNRILCGGTE